MTSHAKPTSPAAQPADKTNAHTAASTSAPPAAGQGIPARTPQPQDPQTAKHPSLSDQADEASLQMPHERDQNTDMTGGGQPEPRIEQAGQDVEQGRQDTSKAVEMDKAYKKL